MEVTGRRPEAAPLRLRRARDLEMGKSQTVSVQHQLAALIESAFLVREADDDAQLNSLSFTNRGRQIQSGQERTIGGSSHDAQRRLRPVG